MSTAGIPTVGPRGIQFRSRIEAQWAYIFDHFGWTWEYEPIDLRGYIPDFIIQFENTKVLVEVKGDTDIWDRTVNTQYINKIVDSGWTGNYMIVGASYKASHFDGWVNIGLWGGKYEDGREGFDHLALRKTKNGDYWDLGGNEMVFDIGWYSTRAPDDQRIEYNWKQTDENGYKLFQKIWTKYKNKVQWKGTQNFSSKR